MQKSIIIVLAMAAMLAACGQGTGTGAQGGTTLGVAAGDQETLQRVKSLQVAQNTNVNISFPAHGVLIGAISDEVKKIDDVLYSCDSFCMLNFVRKALGSDGGWRPPAADAEHFAGALLEDGQQQQEWLSEIKHPFFRSLVANSKSGDIQKIKDEFERMRYAEEIIRINKPNSGWPVPVLASRRNKEANKEVGDYIRLTQESIEFSNLVLTDLASMLSAGAWRDPAAAKEAALIAWRNIPIQKLRDAWAASKALPYSRPTVDLTGHKDIHFWSAEGDYVGDGAGWTVIRHGAPWYGNGYLSGRQVTISLASAISASQSQQSGTATSTGNNSSLDAGSNSQVK